MLDRVHFLDDEDLSSEVLVLYECERNRATSVSVLVGAVQARALDLRDPVMYEFLTLRE